MAVGWVTDLWILVGWVEEVMGWHGRKSRGDESPQNLQWGTLIQVVPPDFLSFFKISSARRGFVPPDFNPDLRHCGLGYRIWTHGMSGLC
jgi:hypothetical protein